MHHININKLTIVLLLFAFTGLISCRNHSRMFVTDKNIVVDSIQKQLAFAEKNYVIQKNDYINILVYTNGGERIIDPNSELNKTQTGTLKPKDEIQRYLIRSNGYVTLPMVGDVLLEGRTLHEADSILGIKFSKFYEGVYITSRLTNKRVVVLGPFPPGGKVIPLENENMNLIEVLALYGGLPDNSKAYNIRLIRGDLKNPNVSIIDLSTIEGMKQASLDVQPNDIVYIEPARKLLVESLRDITPVISILVSGLTLLLVLLKNNN
jgi:polysaccharide export outer membrane protein